MASVVLRVGLTGNIAAGKSTVAGCLAELGCFVIDLDEVAHECLRPSEPTHAEVVVAFGEEILDGSGGIDRQSLGRIVFADEAARERLEGILHPAIRDREQRAIERWAEDTGGGIAVTEAALLFETGGAARYDRMVVVTAPPESRLQRLVDSGLEAAAARERMAAQMDQQQKAALADYVVDNSGSIDTTRAATERLLELLKADLECLSSGNALSAP